MKQNSGGALSKETVGHKDVLDGVLAKRMAEKLHYHSGRCCVTTRAKPTPKCLITSSNNTRRDLRRSALMSRCHPRRRNRQSRPKNDYRAPTASTLIFMCGV